MSKTWHVRDEILLNDSITEKKVIRRMTQLINRAIKFLRDREINRTMVDGVKFLNQLNFISNATENTN